MNNYLVFAIACVSVFGASPVSGESVVVSTHAVIPSSSSWRSVPQTVLKAGEKLNFVLRWGLVKAGESSLEIEAVEPFNGRSAYRIVSRARSSSMVEAFYKVRDINQSWLDTEALVSLRFEKRIREGKYQIDEDVVFDHPNRRFKADAFRPNKNRRKQTEGEIPPNILDVFSSLYYVRTLPLVVGETYVMDVFSDNKVYPLSVKVIKKQKIKTAAGKFACLLVEPQLRGPGIFVSKGKKLEVWITDDARRLPVQMRSEIFIGSVTAELTSMEPKE